MDELDYEREARDNIEFSRLYQGGEHDVIAPRVVEAASSRRVLTMSWIDGIKLDAWGRLDQSKQARLELVASGVQCTVKQFFEKGFFHADPRAGGVSLDQRPFSALASRSAARPRTSVLVLVRRCRWS